MNLMCTVYHLVMMHTTQSDRVISTWKLKMLQSDDTYLLPVVLKSLTGSMPIPNEALVYRLLGVSVK